MRISEKRVLSFLICILMLVGLLPQLQLPSLASDALTGTCGTDVTWSLSDAGTLTISGSGAIKDCSANAPWRDYRSRITNVVIESGVTSIGTYAFSDCSNLTAVTIPNSVTYIGEHAFSGCTGLTAVTIPESVTVMGLAVFIGCSSLTSVTFLGAAPEIDYPFYYENYPDPLPFADVTATAYHRCGDKTWKSSVKKEYGGNLTWKGHLYGEYLPHQDATCTENATQIRTCPDCGTTETMPIPDTAIGHSYENGSCTLCGEAFVLASGSCGENVTWTLSSTGTLTISGSGSMYNYEYDYEEWYHYGNATPWWQQRSLITNVVLQNGVTSIGDCAFYGCGSLTTVTIPNSVNYIGRSAFYGCRNLPIVTIPEGVTDIAYEAFYGCDSLTMVSIPESVTSIGGWAFEACSSLTTLTLPKNVTSIGEYAFSDCSGLTTVNLPERLTSIGDAAFCFCSSLTTIAIPESVTSIGHSMFYGCSSLTEVRIPENVTSFGYGAFYGCSSLTKVTLPESVTSIGEYTFRNCSSLTTITIPNSVTSIGYYAFSGCSSLTAITIPDRVNSIRHSAFSDCNSLRTVIFLGSAPTEDDYWLGVPFSGVTATAYYPCGDNSWTEDVKQNYGGDLTWEAVHVYSDDVSYRNATCTEDAAEIRTCLRCSATKTIALLGTATGHSYKNGKCTACGAMDENAAIIPGDTTGDGKLNIMDVAKLYAIIKSSAPITDPTAMIIADYNGDGKINIMDVAKLYATIKSGI